MGAFRGPAMLLQGPRLAHSHGVRLNAVCPGVAADNEASGKVVVLDNLPRLVS